MARSKQDSRPVERENLIFDTDGTVLGWMTPEVKHLLAVLGSPINQLDGLIKEPTPALWFRVWCG